MTSGPGEKKLTRGYPMHQTPKTKRGRPRRYTLAPQPGIANAEAAEYAAALGELRERVYDQIVDLPDEAINFAARGTTFSIGWLAAHMALGEADWMGRIAEAAVPASILTHPDARLFTPYGSAPATFGPAARLIELGRLVESEATIPTLASLESLERETNHAALTTVRKVLVHLLWHWSFHSGHVGLIRLQWGSEYDWVFEPTPSESG